MNGHRLWRRRLRNICAAIAMVSGAVLLTAMWLVVAIPEDDNWWLPLLEVSWVVLAVSIVLTFLIDVSGETGESSDW